MSDMRTIRVSGKGKIKVRPDMTRINITLEDIYPEYESYKEKGVYKQRLTGYRYEHRMMVEFESDNERLGKILYALAHCPLKPEFNISFTVKDPEAAKNELLGSAVRDAMNKASVLGQAAGVSLKEILNIDYSWSQINFNFRPMDRLMMAESIDAMEDSAGSYDLDIEPDDITASDTVTVIWEIG